jgi:hypothetical protein
VPPRRLMDQPMRSQLREDLLRFAEDRANL